MEMGSGGKLKEDNDELQVVDMDKVRVGGVEAHGGSDVGRPDNVEEEL